MSEADRFASVEAAAKAEAKRARKAAKGIEKRVEKVGDESLADYERRRRRLESELTGELPDDSPEPI